MPSGGFNLNRRLENGFSRIHFTIKGDSKYSSGAYLTKLQRIITKDIDILADVPLFAVGNKVQNLLVPGCHTTNIPDMSFNQRLASGASIWTLPLGFLCSIF